MSTLLTSSPLFPTDPANTESRLDQITAVNMIDTNLRPTKGETPPVKTCDWSRHERERWSWGIWPTGDGDQSVGDLDLDLDFDLDHPSEVPVVWCRDMYSVPSLKQPGCHSGRWTVDGEWKMEDGGWRMEDGSR